MEKIILASSSPRRLALLEKMGVKFKVIVPSCDENILGKKFSYDLIEDLAEKKGLSVLKKSDMSGIIISADTVVILGSEVLGKPKDFQEAYNMLSKLSGKTHKVVTGVCIIDIEKNQKIIKSQTSEVIFNKLSEEEIKNYINEKKPYDKAGAYGIQELPEGFIKEIKGEYNNIVGLPTELLRQMLNEITKESV